jgi:hypothetical protein
MPLHIASEVTFLTQFAEGIYGFNPVSRWLRKPGNVSLEGTAFIRMAYGTTHIGGSYIRRLIHLGVNHLAPRRFFQRCMTAYTILIPLQISSRARLGMRSKLPRCLDLFSGWGCGCF